MIAIRHRQPSRRGFALLEMLFCIMATAMIIMICGRLMYQVGRVYREAPESMNAIQSSQQWLLMFRCDVWGAKDISKGSDGALMITVDARSITWRAESNRIVRTEGDLTAKWPTDGAVSFEQMDGVWLIQSAKSTIALPQTNRGNP